MAATGSGHTYTGAVIATTPTDGTPQEAFEKLAGQSKLGNLITAHLVGTLNLAASPTSCTRSHQRR
jgi:hypothetical protein